VVLAVRYEPVTAASTATMTPVTHCQLERVLPGNNRPRKDLSLSEAVLPGENDASDEQEKH
jgi:hypothetical protein